MPRYRHYRNTQESGTTLFITTTVLDFVHAFRRDEAKDAMVAAIARECKRAEAALYGYVVMPHHVHLLVRRPEKLNGPQFMRVFKRQSSGSVAKLLTADELREFDQQRGLNGNTFSPMLTVTPCLERLSSWLSRNTNAERNRDRMLALWGSFSCALLPFYSPKGTRCLQLTRSI